jgi:hypothetical protein
VANVSQSQTSLIMSSFSLLILLAVTVSAVPQRPHSLDASVNWKKRFPTWLSEFKWHAPVGLRTPAKRGHMALR